MELQAILVRVAVLVVGSLCYALLNVLSQLSKEPDGSYAYSLPTVVLLAEFVKLCISMGYLTRDNGGSILTALNIVLATPAMTWALFAVPSVVYAINNNLDMLNNKYMDPATESVLVQLKILTTAVMWWLVFAQQLNRRKWGSLVLLFVGCSGAGWPTSSGAEVLDSMYIKPFGLVLISMYVNLSAFAGVFNEWLYKGVGKNDSIHLCNIRIYVVGVSFCFCTHCLMQNSEDKNSSLFYLCKGYNIYTWGLVATYSLMGLILAQIVKRYGSIVKLFISGSSMYFSAVLSLVLFGRIPSALFMASISLVTLAIFLYNWESIQPLLVHKHGD